MLRCENCNRFEFEHGSTDLCRECLRRPACPVHTRLCPSCAKKKAEYRTWLLERCRPIFIAFYYMWVIGMCLVWGWNLYWLPFAFFTHWVCGNLTVDECEANPFRVT